MGLILFLVFLLLLFFAMELDLIKRARGNPTAESLFCRWGFHSLELHEDEHFGHYTCRRCPHTEDVNPYIGG